MICTSCGEDSVLEMTEHAQTVCTRCGTVLSENAIVSEVQFGETGSGAAMVQGAYISNDQTRARAPAGYRQRNGNQESREQTLYNGRRRIQELATGLRLSEHLQNVAIRFFNLAVNMNFTKGRRTQYVAAACLYAACRQQNGTQMLIDFSDLLEINVFVLGSTFLKLVRELNINLPLIDPVIYITRFAALLDFGEETQKVALDATRLVNRMGRDWMQIGRRPSGICGACLLLAARMNNFRRSIEEVVQVVKIADATLRKRLAEFKETASGTLTVNDFRSIWLEETHDPPAYTQGIRKEEVARKEKERKLRAESEMSEGESVFGDRAFRELAEREGTQEVEEGGRAHAEGKENEPDLQVEPEVEGEMAPPPKPSERALGKRKRVEPAEAEEGEDAPNPSSDQPEVDPVDEFLEDRDEFDQVIAGELRDTLDSRVGAVLSHELDEKEQARFKLSQSPALDQSTSLDDLDEDELDAFILTEEEVEAKSRLWMAANKDYLKELAEKQTGPDGELKPVSKRPRKKVKPRDGANATGINAADATSKMLEKKKFSKKINYDAIKNLFDAGSEAGSTYGGGDDDDDEPLIGQKYGRKRGRHQGPIVTPEPTWRRGRGGSRAPSEAPSVATSQREGAGREEPDDHVEPEREEEDDAWRSQFATQQHEDDGDYGWDECPPPTSPLEDPRLPLDHTPGTLEGCMGPAQRVDYDPPTPLPPLRHPRSSTFDPSGEDLSQALNAAGPALSASPRPSRSIKRSRSTSRGCSRCCCCCCAHTEERRRGMTLLSSSVAGTMAQGGPGRGPERASSRKRQRTAAIATVGLAALAWVPITAASPVAAPTIPTPRPSSPRVGTPDPPSPPPYAASLSAPSPPTLSPALTPLPTSPTLRKRVPPRYLFSDGQWVEDYGWTLRGSAAASPSLITAAIRSSDDEDDEDGRADDVRAYHDPVTRMEDHVASISSSPSPTASPSASPTVDLAQLDVSPSSSTAATAASATSTFNIPDGWEPRTRQTNYYAVPIIVAMSVLVAIMVVSAIFATVFVRRKNRRRERRRAGKVDEGDEGHGEKGWRRRVKEAVVPGARAKTGADRAGKRAKRSEDAGGGGEADVEGSNGSGTGHRRVRTTGFAAGPRVKPRRRRRWRGGDGEGEDDEGTALTRTGTRSSTSSAGPRDTLTARLSARFRSDRAAPSRPAPNGAATVFSRDVQPSSSHSLTASALSRMSSHATNTSSVSSLPPPSAPLSASTHSPAPHILFTPADDPTLQAQPHIPGSPLHRTATAHSHASSRSSLDLTAAASTSSAAPPLVDPLLPATSSFGALISSDALPVPGPPAYRASSSTVQQTRRYASDGAAAGTRTRAGQPSSAAPAASSLRSAVAPVVTGGFGRRAGRRSAELRMPPPVQQEEEEEERWHWPGEKRRPFPSEVGAASSSGPSAPIPLEDEEDERDGVEDEREEEERQEVDRSLFSAHVATDDKAVLARLRARNDRLASSAMSDEEEDIYASSAAAPSAAAPSLASRPVATAPPVEEHEEVDEEGFERIPSSLLTTSAPATTPSTLLPAPPALLSYSYLTASPPSPSVPASLPRTPFLPPMPSPALSTAPLLASSASGPTAATEKSALAAEYAAAGLAGEEDEEDEESYLPRYGVGGGPVASAPPPDEEEDEHEEGEEALRRSEEGWAIREVGRRNEGEREEHAEV
ncbi:hypothetical protein JCM11251_001094 [Rhodosporidiobolus azoricus]